jgi:hypothetical protein
MSSILSVVASFVRTLGKEDVSEDIRITREEISQKLIPLYSEANLFFKTHKFKDERVINLSNTFMGIVNRDDKYKNMIDAISNGLPKVLANIDQLSTMLLDSMESKSVTDSLTYRKAVLLHGIDLASFCSMYLFKLLTYVYIYEDDSSEEGYRDLTLAPPVLKAIVGNIGNFARVFKVLSEKSEKFYADLKNLKDLPLDKKTLDTAEAFYDNDPLADIQLTAGFQGSPIYHYRLMIAEWQANRYKLHKETKQYLELKLANLKMKDSKSPDPKIEREIEYLASRIEKLDYALAKQEKSVGGLE